VGEEEDVTDGEEGEEENGITANSKEHSSNHNTKMRYIKRIWEQMNAVVYHTGVDILLRIKEGTELTIQNKGELIRSALKLRGASVGHYETRYRICKSNNDHEYSGEDHHDR